jgi:RNA polymerase sigma-70 factor, ECF subfamily
MRARLDARRLAAALARLPAEQRAVLSLFALDGLGHREIAEILGVPEGTVWSRLHGARKRLAAELGGEG